MSPQKYLLAARFLQSCNSITEPIAITLRIPRPGRTIRAILPVRQITTQHQKPVTGKRLSNSNQKWRIGIRSRAMRQYQTGAWALFGTMEKSANRRNQRVIVKTLGGSRHKSSRTENWELSTYNWVSRLQDPPLIVTPGEQNLWR